MDFIVTMVSAKHRVCGTYIIPKRLVGYYGIFRLWFYRRWWIIKMFSSIYAISILLYTANKPKKEYANIHDGVWTFFENYSLRLVLHQIRLRLVIIFTFQVFFFGYMKIVVTTHRLRSSLEEQVNMIHKF